MITVKQAQRLIAQNIPPLRKERSSLAESLGCILAEEIRAPFDLPLFDNSAMDGFALRSIDTRFASPKMPILLEIKGVAKAGDNCGRPLGTKETYRIMTGALIPKGADTILPKEDAVVKVGARHAVPLLIINHPIKKGRHIRRKGEELLKGKIVLRKGVLIQPGTVGFLASLGKDKITVYRRPRVTLITTGNELVEPGEILREGEIYNSNRWMISAALRQMGIHHFFVDSVRDQMALLKEKTRQALKRSDLLILTGGVSVGDYDYTKVILERLGVRTIFWKVSQKPGKPIYFGKKGTTLIFGLPGNPASVFVCFYEYVFPALRAMMGFKNPYLAIEALPLGVTVKADREKLLFLKGKIASTRKGKIVFPLGHQGSHMTSSLSDSDGLILIPPQKRIIRRGEKVEVHLL